ncbi:MAG TPA: OsmC family protein [Flavobacterium sp.]|nr:OsmC family protein [Flavobacterium sp.]
MTKVTASTGKILYKTEIKSATNTIIADEPVDVGGQDLGFKPGELLAAALASCTGITLRMYADRKGWDLEESMIEVTMENDTPEKPNITMNIRLFGKLDETQRQRLLEIANNCPIHKMLEHPVAVQTVLKD